ncbi:hypothetical protein HU200_005403 [Digitaria exilis]|uniref:DUF1618 domain-containing protein n=1 Tax=Digitaria exilis TaxID=1010633 RepID=A0A835FS21_9POAL|nr:hypothetical protein HU200_005403 [Digitaria exilis]
MAPMPDPRPRRWIRRCWMPGSTAAGSTDAATGSAAAVDGSTGAGAPPRRSGLATLETTQQDVAPPCCFASSHHAASLAASPQVDPPCLGTSRHACLCRTPPSRATGSEQPAGWRREREERPGWLEMREREGRPSRRAASTATPARVEPRRPSSRRAAKPRHRERAASGLEARERGAPGLAGDEREGRPSRRGLETTDEREEEAAGSIHFHILPVYSCVALHMAALFSKTTKAELHLLRHAEWSIQQPELFMIHGAAAFHDSTDGKLMCWADFRRGLIFCNVYDETPVLRYVLFPPADEEVVAQTPHITDTWPMPTPPTRMVCESFDARKHGDTATEWLVLVDTKSNTILSVYRYDKECGHFHGRIFIPSSVPDYFNSSVLSIMFEQSSYGASSVSKPTSRDPP